jgi:pimeloyl-ACP methyl ester carboxylesterase
LTVFHSDGVDINYHAAGTGKPVVLVHGFASSHRINWINTGWIDQLTRNGRQVIAPDLRGHGDSTKFYSPADYPCRLMGQDIIGLMDRLEIESADMIGYSMGAWISSYLMVRFPERFNAVVLGGIGAVIMEFHQRGEQIARALSTPYPEQITQPFLRALREFSELAGNDLRALTACARGVYSDGPPNFQSAEKPVLVITGEKDDVAGPPEKLAALIPNAQTVIVPACDHLTALTRREYQLEVFKFLDRHPHKKASLTQ